MTSRDFRRLALSLPGVEQGAHMRHADFRLAGKIFATLGYPRAGCGIVKLTPLQQEDFVREHPEAFAAAAGAWGRRGSTTIALRFANVDEVRDALAAAHRRLASKGKSPRG